MLWRLHHGMYGDGMIRFRAISAWLEQGTLPPMPYSIVGPAFSIPFWLIGRMYNDALNWCTQYNLFLFAFGMLVSYLLLRKYVDGGLLRKFYLVLIIASMFPMHVTAYYGEVFTAVCVGFGIMVLLRRSAAVGGWVAIILGVVNTPASLFALGCVVLKRLLDSKRWRYILVVVAAGGLIMAENWIRRGGPFVTGYANDHGFRTIMPYSGLAGFSYPFFFGLLSILFSFGKGLIFFAPGLILPVRSTLLKWQQEKQVPLYSIYLLWISFLIGLILVYARWWAWYGGLFWGPRFFLFASIPASFALAARLQDKQAPLIVNLLALLALALSCWVGFDGAIFNNQVASLSTCMADNARWEMLCHYTPEFSVLWYPFVGHMRPTQQQILDVVYWGIASAYLLIPLLIKIVEQLIEPLRNYWREYLNIRQWRF